MTPPERDIYRPFQRLRHRWPARARGRQYAELIVKIEVTLKLVPFADETDARDLRVFAAATQEVACANTGGRAVTDALVTVGAALHLPVLREPLAHAPALNAGVGRRRVGRVVEQHVEGGFATVVRLEELQFLPHIVY